MIFEIKKTSVADLYSQWIGGNKPDKKLWDDATSAAAAWDAARAARAAAWDAAIDRQADKLLELLLTKPPE